MMRPLGKCCPNLQGPARKGWAQVALEFLFPPVTHHAGQRNAHGANLFAAPTKGRCIGQVMGVLNANERWRQDGTHGARIDPAVGVTPNRAVDRAIIHARRAANTPEHVLALAPNDVAASIVEQHHVIFVNTVRVVSSFRSGHERSVNGKGLANCRPRQKAQQCCCIVESRNDLFNTTDDDVHTWLRHAKIAVPLVGDNHGRAGLGDQKVRAGNPDVSA